MFICPYTFVSFFNPSVPNRLPEVAMITLEERFFTTRYKVVLRKMSMSMNLIMVDLFMVKNMMNGLLHFPKRKSPLIPFLQRYELHGLSYSISPFAEMNEVVNWIVSNIVDEAHGSPLPVPEQVHRQPHHG